jgi:hypothetical protein
MPGYLAHDAGGTLPWSWAEQRLVTSSAYWVGSVRPDGRPHSSPVWGVWFDMCFWFSCDRTSIKARNIANNPLVVVTNDDPWEQVVLEGEAQRVASRDDVVRYVDAERVKYADRWNEQLYTVDFFAGGTYRVRPRSVFALEEKRFGTSPTTFTFSDRGAKVLGGS